MRLFLLLQVLFLVFHFKFMSTLYFVRILLQPRIFVINSNVFCVVTKKNGYVRSFSFEMIVSSLSYLGLVQSEN